MKPLVPPQLSTGPTPSIPTRAFATPNANLNKAPFRKDDFNNLIIQQGIKVKVFKTTWCPNVASIDAAEHDINCTVCLGNGLVDRNPVETFAYISHAERDPQFFLEGEYEIESIYGTFPSDIELTYYTLVQLMDVTEQYIQLVNKQEGPIDFLKYPCKRVNLLIDQNGREYIPGQHFTLTVNGDIQWLPGKGMKAGTIYSINYDITIQFRAMKAVHAFRFVQEYVENGNTAVTKLPQKWALKREYLVEKTDFRGKIKLPVNKLRSSDPSNLTSNPE